MNTSDRIRAVADPLIRYGYTPSQVQNAVLQAIGIGIGGGGAGNQTVIYPGPVGELDYCPYCGATGGGGHGGFCPATEVDSG